MKAGYGKAVIACNECLSLGAQAAPLVLGMVAAVVAWFRRRWR